MAFRSIQNVVLLLCISALCKVNAFSNNHLRIGGNRMLSTTDHPDVICVENIIIGADLKMKVRNTRTDEESGWVPTDHSIGDGDVWCYNLTLHFSDLKEGDDFHTEVTANNDKDHADCHPHVNYKEGGGKHKYVVNGVKTDLACSS